MNSLIKIVIVSLSAFHYFVLNAQTNQSETRWLEDTPKSCSMTIDSTVQDTFFCSIDSNFSCQYIALDSLRDGTWIFSFEDRTRILTIKDSVLHGFARELRGDQLLFQFNFVNGRLDGTCYRYEDLDDYCLREIGQYRFGKPSGIFIHFYTTGEVASVTNHGDIKKTLKKYLFFDKNGKLITADESWRIFKADFPYPRGMSSVRPLLQVDVEHLLMFPR
jgi:hypothetical protein